MLDLEIGTLLALALPVLGFVHKRILGGVTGFVTGGPLGAASGFLQGGQQATPPTMPGMPGLPQGIPQFPTFGGNGGGAPAGGAPSMLRCQTVPPGIGCETVGPGWQRHPSNSMLCCPPGGANGAPAGTQIACPSGYRPNKSSYFRKDVGWVEKGTRCVKVRRRNPLNPRALDRAISRISSAKRASKKLGRVTVRKKKC